VISRSLTFQGITMLLFITLLLADAAHSIRKLELWCEVESTYYGTSRLSLDCR